MGRMSLGREMSILYAVSTAQADDRRSLRRENQL